jgi:hypothetical protein
MTRRRAICCSGLAVLAAAGALQADDRTDALDAVTPLATALANSDPDGFAGSLPKELANREEIRANVAALIAAAEVTSSVEVNTAGKGTAELDWYMQIRSRATAMIVEQRRGTVNIGWKKKKLVLLEPASFFGPPKLTSAPPQ